MTRRDSTGSATTALGDRLAVVDELWSARARDWADIQEGPYAWGEPLYRLALERLDVSTGTAVLDVGCGAGRFCSMAAERGADVAGIDAASGLLEIARERTPAGDFRRGDMTSLSWDDGCFDLVTGFSTFQFAADPVVALREARRVARSDGHLVAAVPGAPADSELTPFLMALRELLPEPPSGGSGPLALSSEGRLEAAVGAAGWSIDEAGELDCPMEFSDEDELTRAMLAPGPAVLAARQAGEEAVREAARRSLAPFRNAAGGYRLENSFRFAIASPAQGGGSR